MAARSAFWSADRKRPSSCPTRRCPSRSPCSSRSIPARSSASTASPSPTARRPASTADDFVEPPEEIGFASGEVARSTSLCGPRRSPSKLAQQLGYAEARVADRQVIADHATDTVDVAILVEPGRQGFIGLVDVRGTERMDPVFVAQQTGLQQGAEYDPDDISRAEKRLARLDVFRAMRIEAAGAIGSDGILPMNVIVEEQAQRRFGVGATYSSIDGLGLEAFHLWRNLFGRAERLRLDAKVAGINWPIDTAEFDYAFGATSPSRASSTRTTTSSPPSPPSAPCCPPIPRPRRWPRSA